MKIILPVAGKGTRLRPHTHTRAKSLVQVAGKTVLEHIIERLKVLAADELIFITDENGQQIEAFMKRVFPDLNCSYIVQKDRLGPAHAVALADPRIAEGDDVLVVFNDTIFVTDLTRIPELCAEADGLIYSKEVEDYQRFGVNVIRNGIIVDMVEKPDTPVSRLAQVGLYYLKDANRFMQYLDQAIQAGDTVKGEFYLPAVFMRMVNDGLRFRAPEIDAWLDCGKPETLLETNRYLLEERHSCQGDLIDTVVIPPVFIADGVTVRGSIIGPYVSLATGTTVEASIVRDSIVNADCQVKDANLRFSILGNGVRLAGSPRRMNIGDDSLIEMDS
ncbi:nucleotidyltransferase [Syntrophotalea carbinolica DSM 2380]|uniref:Nucleotidyltransferase n=1 Tax=Syntrophotalea carbinolica (strain DSM 2380 / NBRC 103641 / GraBd1) TaxID=338963 RepID=Q3A7V7_SYNC1|nr:sugar phosphate nucleotidyltransferase [Syntrophotalea carbinolica]ABA87537.1 nucleotidyltransferase [Syntrophotalea carbinolica DSM 2380]